MNVADYRLGPRIPCEPHGVLVAGLHAAGPGAVVEFGVGKGKSLRVICEERGGLVVGFDSFAGLPEDWRPGFEKGRFACTPPSIPGALLVIGRFADTLAGKNPFDLRVLGPVALAHVDCDLYSSTRLVLEALGPVLRSGVVIVFDEWHGYPGCEDHEQRAWTEFTAGRPWLSWQVLGHGEQAWAIRVD